MCTKSKKKDVEMKLDQIDLNIIEELKKDSRLSMRELGRKIKLSPPSVTERVRQLESFGIIKQYTLEVDQKNWGFPFPALWKQPLKTRIMSGSKAIFKHCRILNFATGLRVQPAIC